MVMELETVLTRQLNESLRSLVDLADPARDGEQARKLAEEIRKVLRALESLPRKVRPDQRFANYRRAIDAAKVIFEETGVPFRPEEIAKVIVEGGFRGGDPGARSHVLKSLSIHLNGRGKETYPLKKVNNKVGPAEWDDALFSDGKE